MKKPATIIPISTGSMLNQTVREEPTIRLNWNYDDLDAETREAAIAATIRMKRTDMEAGQLAWEIGRDLIEQKERVGHGNWLAWLSAEMGYSDATAENLMRIYRQFPDLGALRTLGRSALALLANNTTPPAVKAAVIAATEAGAPPTYSEIRTMKQAATEPVDHRVYDTNIGGNTTARTVSPIATKYTRDTERATATNSTIHVEQQAPAAPTAPGLALTEIDDAIVDMMTHVESCMSAGYSLTAGYTLNENLQSLRRWLSKQGAA